MDEACNSIKPSHDVRMTWLLSAGPSPMIPVDPRWGSHGTHMWLYEKEEVLGSNHVTKCVLGDNQNVPMQFQHVMEKPTNSPTPPDPSFRPRERPTKGGEFQIIALRSWMTAHFPSFMIVIPCSLDYLSSISWALVMSVLRKILCGREDQVPSWHQSMHAQGWYPLGPICHAWRRFLTVKNPTRPCREGNP